VRGLLAVTAVAALAIAACGGDDDEITPTDIFTPAGTKADTPTPAASGVGGAPAPADPQMDDELTEIASGELDHAIGPGESAAVIPLDTVADLGSSCDAFPNFAFSFSWQVTDPFPPDGVQISWHLDRDSGSVRIADGPAGEQTVGCEPLSLINDGDAAASVSIRYRVGALQ
jgi:hypothetical protein